MKLVFQKFLAPTHGDGVFNRVTSTAGVVISNSCRMAETFEKLSDQVGERAGVRVCWCGCAHAWAMMKRARRTPWHSVMPGKNA